jgi:hypothetical protein
LLGCGILRKFKTFLRKESQLVKRKIVVELEDISAVRLTCRECERGGVLLPFDEEESVWPYCPHAQIRPEDPTLKLLAMLGALIKNNPPTAFSIALELNE